MKIAGSLWLKGVQFCSLWFYAYSSVFLSDFLIIEVFITIPFGHRPQYKLLCSASGPYSSGIVTIFNSGVQTVGLSPELPAFLCSALKLGNFKYPIFHALVWKGCIKSVYYVINELILTYKSQDTANGVFQIALLQNVTFKMEF